MTEHKPKFKHNCDDCLFLGHMELTFEGTKSKAADLYSHNHVSIIARYSDEPSDNSSWSLDMSTSNPYILVAQCQERHRIRSSNF